MLTGNELNKVDTSPKPSPALEASLEQIEGIVWPSPITDDPLTLIFHLARKKPISILSFTEITLLFQQGYCRELLVRRALQILVQQSHTAHDDELLDLVLSFFIHHKKPSQEEILQVLQILESIPDPKDELDQYLFSYTLISLFKDIFRCNQR